MKSRILKVHYLSGISATKKKYSRNIYFSSAPNFSLIIAVGSSFSHHVVMPSLPKSDYTTLLSEKL